MLTFFKAALALFGIGILAYIVHVPLLKFWTAPSANSELAAYPPLSGRIVGNSHTLEKIVDGRTLEILFDPKNRIYIIVAESFGYNGKDYSGRHIIILEQNGDLRDIRRIDQAHLDLLLNATTLDLVDPIFEQKNDPIFSFDNSKGRIELVHYQFLKFKDWPYLYYFIPVIPSDWKGMAYLKVKHDGETFRIKVPTNYNGGYLYTLGNIDGQIYLRKRPDETTGVAFLQVDESSYTRDMNGIETHRQGYGLYLIRRNNGS